MNTPTTLKYTKDHEWISIENGIATISVDILDFGTAILRDLELITFVLKGEIT